MEQGVLPTGQLRLFQMAEMRDTAPYAVVNQSENAMEISTTSPQATGVDTGGGGLRVTKIAQDQQKAQGQAAVQLIEAAGAVSQPRPSGTVGQNIDVRV